MKLLELRVRIADEEKNQETFILKLGDERFSHSITIDKDQGSEFLSMLRDRHRIIECTRSEAKESSTMIYTIR